MRKHLRHMVLVALAALLAASCSGGGGSGDRDDARVSPSSVTSPVRIAHIDADSVAVTYYVEGAVRIVNTVTLEEESSFRPYGKPVAVAFANNILFVSNQYNSSPHQANVDAYDLSGQYLYTASGGYGQLARPSDMAVDEAAELLFVVDAGDAKVHVYHMYNGAAVDSFPGLFTVGSQKVVHPTGIALDKKNGLVYVSDYGGVAGAHGTGEARIQVYDYSGIHQVTIASDQPGYEFSTPQGLAVGADWDDLYVVDALQGTIFVFNSSGGGIGTIGSMGLMQGELMLPLDVSLHDPSGDIFVTNNRLDRIEAFRGEMK